jgi:hypothetical protein
MPYKQMAEPTKARHVILIWTLTWQLWFTALNKSVYLRGGLISPWLYKESNKLRDIKNVFTRHIPLSSTHL